MARLWPTLVFLFSACLSGCSGRTMEGAWYGPLPFKGADSCRIRLQKGGSFDFSCQGLGPLGGIGKYQFENNSLTLEFFAVTSGEDVVPKPPPIHAKVSGPGNNITLLLDDNTSIAWERRSQ